MSSKIKERLRRELIGYIDARMTSPKSRALMSLPDFDEILRHTVDWLYTEKINATLEFANHVSRTISDTRETIKRLHDKEDEDFLEELYRL